MQDALQLMLDRRMFELSEEELSRLRSGLESERGENQFGSSTLDLIRFFQESRGLELNGFVDRPTAAALNHELARLRAFENPFEDKQRLLADLVSDQVGRFLGKGSVICTKPRTIT